MMQVNMVSGGIPLLGGDAITPCGTLLSVTASELEISRIDTIVLVENGITARYWHKCRIPCELSKALMVYRGHDSQSKTVRQWLRQLPATVQKIGYFDFDPAGLGMAIDYQMDAILIPDPINDQLIKGINNKPEAHDNQLVKRPDLGQQLPETCHDMWQWMIGKGRKCAVTQERLTVLDWSLRLLDFSQGNNAAI
jgi:hypothetical protein